jgi:hypothetical protein
MHSTPYGLARRGSINGRFFKYMETQTTYRPNQHPTEVLQLQDDCTHTKSSTDSTEHSAFPEFLSPKKGKKVKLSICLTNEGLRHEGVWGSGCTDPHS